MKNDARNLLNRKKWKNQSFLRVGKNFTKYKSSQRTLDARKIINSKNKPQLRRNLRINASVNKKKPTFNKGVRNYFQSQDSKRIRILPDGNISITAKSGKQQPERQTITRQWEPSRVDTDDLEHLSINDLINMETLPTAISSNVLPQQSYAHKYVADDIFNLENTMVADQFADSNTQSSIKIHVSNLNSTVTEQDIMELFSDIGPIRELDVSQPGTAVIEYYDVADAQNACEIYNDRLLDGKAMKCYMESVSVHHKPVIQRLGNRISQSIPVHITQSSPTVIHGQYSSFNSRLRYNPHDVKFTVKI